MRWRIDPRRVYVAGLSADGAMALTGAYALVRSTTAASLRLDSSARCHTLRMPPDEG